MNFTMEPLQAILSVNSSNLSTPFPEEVIRLLSELTSEDIECFINLSKNHSKKAGSNYCNDNLREIGLAYRGVHGYLSLIVCVFGTIANILNIIVLTRKDMVSPINKILTGLAVADMLVMVEYIPFSCIMYLLRDKQDDDYFAYGLAVFVLFHAHFTQVLHTISICLTLALAIWRYIAITYPQESHVLCSSQRCYIAIIVSYILPPIICIPSYMMFTIKSTCITQNLRVAVLYNIGISHLSEKNDRLFHKIHFWVYGVMVKLLPCLILTVISYWLIKALCRANKHKQRLNKQCREANGEIKLGSIGKDEDKKPNPKSKSEKRTERTTKMLVAVLLLFLVTEFPQGILALLSGIHGHMFFTYCYHVLGDIMDILALLNSAINFILYCCMSRQFRTTFGALFKPQVLTKWSQASQTEVQSTYV